MRWNRLLAMGTALGTLALIPVGAHARSATEPDVSDSTAVTTVPPTSAREPVLGVEKSRAHLAGEPALYFDRARVAIADKHYATATTDLRKAAALVAAAADRDSHDTRTKLARDAAALQALASDVETGQVKDVKAFDARLVRTRADLAGHHYLESAEAWARKDTIAAGRSLAAAARYAEGAMSSAGQVTETDISRGLKAAESFGEHLANKTTTGTEQAWTTASDAVRRAIEKIAQVAAG